jgi:hypothetical protein
VTALLVRLLAEPPRIAPHPPRRAVHGVRPAAITCAPDGPVQLAARERDRQSLPGQPGRGRGEDQMRRHHRNQAERVFYNGGVKVPGTDKQTQLLAQIADVCRWYAAGGPPTAQRQAAALAELAHITAGRTDLLARYAGQSLAGHRGPDATVHERAIQLCITAGADMSLIERCSRDRLPHRAT